MRSLLPSLSRRDGDPFGQFRRDMETLIDDFGTRMPTGFARQSGGALAPAVDVSETNDGLEISAELPGVAENDVEVHVEDRLLTIRGEKKSETEDKDRHVYERSYGAFQRSMSLPFAPHPDKVAAHFDKGVLKIAIPRPPEAKARSKKIAIGKK